MANKRKSDDKIKFISLDINEALKGEDISLHFD